MNSQTYVTDPSMWERFYKNMAKKNFNPYKYNKRKRINQTGRGLHGRYRDSYLVPVNSNAADIDANVIPTTIVSPVAAAEDRALSEMKADTEKPHVKVRKDIKRRKRKKKVSREKSSKRSRPTQRKKKPPRKRKNNNEYGDSVWNPSYNKKRRK